MLTQKEPPLSCSNFAGALFVQTGGRRSYVTSFKLLWNRHLAGEQVYSARLADSISLCPRCV